MVKVFRERTFSQLPSPVAMKVFLNKKKTAIKRYTLRPNANSTAVASAFTLHCDGVYFEIVIIIIQMICKCCVLWCKICYVVPLTDPRIQQNDYVSFGIDPLQPPPDNLNCVKDLNTRLAFMETHKQPIKNNFFFYMKQ